MENIEKTKFELKLISGLKMDSLDSAEGILPKTEKGYIAQAEKKVYLDDDGNLAVPAGALHACMREAVKNVSGRKQKQEVQTLRSQLWIKPRMLTILPARKKHDGIGRDWVTRNTGTPKQTRVKTYRPFIKEGTIEGTIESIGLDRGYIKQILDNAGIRYGLLGHRPEYGRFEVTKFEEVR